MRREADMQMHNYDLETNDEQITQFSLSRQNQNIYNMSYH